MKLLQRIPAPADGAFRPFEDEAVEQSIPQRFEQQVRAKGDCLAIKWDRGSYDYAALNETANRLARAMRTRRGDAAEPVALLFEHGGEVLAAIIAVLKAGKFYVVLDPGYPPDRLQYMLVDSGARLMVADASHSDYARQLCGSTIELIVFDNVDRSMSGADLADHPAPGNLAMILYTSGSTGRPKGVMHSHRNVLADVRNLTNGWRITADDRWVLYTPIGFANSVRTIYSSLLNGGAVYPFDVKSRGFGGLADWLADNGITIVRGVPTFFRNFAATLEEGRTFPSVRILSLGGESMLGADLGYFNRHFSPRCVLSHAFGPTECLTVCWALIEHGTPAITGKLPIGHSLPDKDVLLLDESRREVAAGELGEIAVRSRYIAPGYWRDPERTRAVFLPDPLGGDTRTYLTGDFGMRTEDGRLIHVGRKDFEVKIRGFRIDVSEIETALRAITGIGDTVVVGRELESGEQRLIAYFVASSTPPVSGRQLREMLARVLPDYMIPSVFVAMDAIPLTPNGKTDRLRLPLPSRNRRDTDTPMKESGSAIESELATIWAEVLGLDQVGIDDAFLDLGGDSLKGAIIAARAGARFELDMSLRVLLDAGTVARMAQVIAGAIGDDGGKPPGPDPSALPRGV